MAYDYDKIKSAFEGMTKEQQSQAMQKYSNDSTFRQFASDYVAERSGSNSNPVVSSSSGNTGVSFSAAGAGFSAGSLTNSINSVNRALQNTNSSGVLSSSYTPTGSYQQRVVTSKSPSINKYTGDDSEHYGILDNKEKTSPDTTYQWGGVDGNPKPVQRPQMVYQQDQNTKVDLTGGDINQNMNKWGDFGRAVNAKLQTAFGIQDLNELRAKYPDQYNSLIQSLDTVAGTWNSLDPSQRGMLEGKLQAIIGTAVGAGSDTSKLNVLNESIMDKFENGEKVAQDMQNIIRLQTEGLSTKDIAKQMGISEDQVQQSILAYNGLDNRLGEYYKLRSSEASKITEPYDTKMERLEEEKNIQLERANQKIEWLKEDFNTNMERQKKANEINAHNADFLAGVFGFGFSTRGIEGLNYVNEQARQLIDDMITNYDRADLQMAQGVEDLIRNWEWTNDDLLKASEDALTQAKNYYTSNMLAIQQKYGTVGMQAQQQLAENVQSFITQAETIYDNALNRQQKNLTNLITNYSNLNALQASNISLRNAKIQQFQAESMNLNRNQLQGLAEQLGMDQTSFQDLANYQVQAVANELNGYVPGAGVQLQSTIKSLLDSGYTPNQALSMIMNSDSFKAMQTTADNGEWKIAGDYMYNTSTGQWQNLAGKSTANGSSNYVTSQTINGQVYGVSEKTIQGLQSFYNKHPKGSIGGQCGSFVNDYLQSLGLGRVFTDPIDKKKAAINTPEGYSPQVGDVVVMDSPYESTKKYGHVAIITGINEDGSFTTLESNRKNNDGVVFSRTIDPSKTKVYGYYHPDGVGTVANQNNYEGGYNPNLEFVFESMAKENGKLDSTTQKNLLDQGYSLEDIGQQYNNYIAEHPSKDSYTLPDGFVVTNQQLFDQVTDKSKINDTIKAYSALQSTAEKLKKLVLEYGTEIRPTRARTNMQQYVRDIQLQAKELYNLGVLNGPDLELMESVIYNPTTKEAKWQSFINGRSKQDIWEIMEEGINTVNEKALIELKNQGISIGNKTEGNTGGGRGLQGTISLEGYGRS